MFPCLEGLYCLVTQVDVFQFQLLKLSLAGDELDEILGGFFIFEPSRIALKDQLLQLVDFGVEQCVDEPFVFICELIMIPFFFI